MIYIPAVQAGMYVQSIVPLNKRQPLKNNRFPNTNGSRTLPLEYVLNEKFIYPTQLIQDIPAPSVQQFAISF